MYVSNLWNAASVVFTQEFVVLRAFIKKEKAKIRLSILFKKLQKEQQIRGKNVKGRK